MPDTAKNDPDEPTPAPTSNEDDPSKPKENADEDSDDDEPIVRRKPSRINRSLLADSDEDEPSETPGKRTRRSRIEDSDEDDDVPLSADVKVSSDEDDDVPLSAAADVKDSSDEEDDVPLSAATDVKDSDDEDGERIEGNQKSRVVRARRGSDSESSSDSGSSDTDDEKPLSSAKGTGGLPGYLFEGDSDSDDGDFNLDSNKSNDATHSEKRTKAVLPDDLFDAEDSDGNSRPQSEGEPESVENDDESEISASLRRKLAQGASKKARPTREGASRPKKEDVQLIHSETQRIIRESDVRLPYHKPERLGISVFLARTQQKQAQLKQVLKHSPVCTWKTAPGLATQPPLKTLPPKHWDDKDSLHSRITAKLSSSQHAVADKEDSLPDIADSDVPTISKPAESPTKSPQKDDCSQIEGMDDELDQRISSADSEAVKNVTEESEPSQLHLQMEIDEDDLPDLVIEVEKKTEKDSADDKETTGDKVTEQTSEKPVAVTVEATECQEKAAGKLEQDSGFLTAPTSEEESSTDKPVEKESVEEHDKSASKSPVPSSSLTPKLGGLGLSFTPKLSGEPSDFIDLDEDEESAGQSQPPKNPGLEKLMHRLVKHSAKHTRKARDVELSTVHKESTGSGPEVLKMERVTVHLEGDAATDPAMEKPGAKLLLLKEKLKSGMQARRAEMRQQRDEVHGFDNEEGFEEEEEEMTDQSDTDGEPEEEMEEEEEEELDEDGDMEEEEEKDKNPFLDEEAEDEDEEGLEEGDMNLQLDTADDDSDEAEGDMPKKPAQDFLKSALKKTQTMEFFDDDAMCESPAISQVEKSSTQSSDISDRPFEQLSQGSKKTSPDPSENAPPPSVLSMDKEDTSQQSADTVSTTGTADTSLDMSSIISAGQRTDKKSRSSFYEGRRTPELFTPSSKGSTVTSLGGKNKVSGSLSNLTLPIEDSQDLLCSNSMPSSQAESTPTQVAPSNFHFSLEDSETHSQLLDADGLFRDKSSDHKHARRQLRLESASNSTNDNYDELLDLCSGKFTSGPSSQGPSKSSAPDGLFGMSQLNQEDSSQQDMDELLGLCSGRFTGSKDSSSGSSLLPSSQRPPLQTQGSMDELLGLCSGTFTTTTDSSSQKRGKKRRQVEEDEEEDDFEIASDVGDADREDEGEGLSDDGDGAEDGDEEDEEVILAKKLFSKKQGKISRAFVEDEAELSGSDAESDEDYDGTEQDDLLEQEAGDMEDLPSDDELRDQVGRVHLKALIDEDKRQLRLYQEMYLEDGDLHSEGAGRQRKFRWKNIDDDDDDTQHDMFRNSDDEGENGDDQENVEQETKWRMERFEREKFLAEQKAAEVAKEESEGSQLVRLGKVVFKQQQNKTTVQEPKPVATPTHEKKTKPTKAMFKVPTHHGSFLRRDKAALAKIAEMTKPVGNLGGARSSGKFVFSTLSPSEPEEKKAKPRRPPPVLRSTSSPASSQPAKKPRLDRKSQSMPSNSIFNLL